MSKKRKEPQRQQIDGACARVLALQPRVFDRDAIKALVGDRVVASMPLVGKEFGVSAITIRQGWKANGMPGGDGKYRLVDILIWRLEHNKKNEKYTKSRTEGSSRMKEIELERAEVALASAKASYEESGGQLVAREQVKAEVSAMLSVFSKTLLDIPRSLAPLLPEKFVSTIVPESEKLIRHALRALSEKAHQTYLKEGDENEL